MKNFFKYFFNNARKSRAFVLYYYPDAWIEGHSIKNVYSKNYKFTKNIIGTSKFGSDSNAWIDARKNLESQFAIESKIKNLENKEIQKKSALTVEVKDKTELF